jgi:hypothetical protein
VTHWLLPAVSTCRYSPGQLRYPRATPSTPRWPGGCRVCPMAHRPVFRGHGATVLPPLKTSPARGRVSVAFPSRRPSKRLYSLPGCAGANRRRPRCFLRGRMCLRTACATVLSACPSVPADPKSANSMRSFGRPRGPRPEQGAAPPVHPRSARAGTAAVRTALPCPVASSCAPTTVTQRTPRPQHAAADRRGPGLDARPSARWCHREHPAAPSGRSFLDAVRNNAEGALIPRPDQGAAWLHPGCTLAAPCGQVPSCLQCAGLLVLRGRQPVSIRHIQPVHKGAPS